MKKIYYLHKPTGWIFWDDPDHPCELINTCGTLIPKSLAVFGNQQDWEITTVWIDELNTLEWVNEVINQSVNAR